MVSEKNGRRYTPRFKFQVVMEILSGTNVLAKEFKVRTICLDAFLDDEQDFFYSSDQIKSLVELAKKNGRALAIGHPFASTIDALRAAIPWLKQQKIAIVFVSELLE